MKKAIAILLSLILAIAIGMFLPMYFDSNKIVNANVNNETSLINQEIVSYSDTENTYHKIYTSGKLIGVITDLDYLNSLIANKYVEYEEDFPNTELGLTDDTYIIDEKSYINFQNIDDQIMNFLDTNDLLGVKTTAVEFSTDSGVYEIIYVKDINDFYEARDAFIMNFVSEETFNKLSNKEKIASPVDNGSVDTNVKIIENIQYKDAIVSPKEIFTSQKDIYTFLCYGRNTQRDHYTVQLGDTLQGVGYYFGDMTPKQIVMLNQDILTSEDQIVTPGMQLNVTYYTSPISVKVTKEVLTTESVFPDAPEYVENSELDIGEIKPIVEEVVGESNVLYQEEWINGVRQSGKQIGTPVVIRSAKQGKYEVGTKQTYYFGTGNYIWPVDNPEITCHWGCYYNHTGTDFVNKYDRYASIYAADSGVVDEIGYKWDMGNYCIIDHQNGVRTFYMHMNTSPYVYEGDNVYRGQVIGQVGNTGNSFGAHLHFTFELNGVRRDPCNYLPCYLIDSYD